MYYFSYSKIDYGKFNYRPYSLYNEGAAVLTSKTTLTSKSIVKHYAKTTITTGTNLSCNTVLRGRHRGSATLSAGASLAINSKVYVLIKTSAQLRSTANVTIKPLLKHYANSTITNSSALTANSKWIFVKRSDGKLKATARVLSAGNIYTQVKASSVIHNNSTLTIDALLKHYEQCIIPTDTALTSDSFVRVLAGAKIKCNADVTTTETVKAFEEAILTGKATVSANGVVREFAVADIEATSFIEVNAIVVIYANVIIKAKCNVATTAKKAIITGLSDTDTYFFNYGGKCYFYNGANYYHYDGNKVGKVTDIAHVPTITLGRSPSGGGTAYEDLNYLSNSWKDSFSGTADAVEYTLSFTGLSDTPVKAWVNGDLKEETTGFTVDRATGIVAFNTPPGEGTDNVVIQAEKADLMNPNYILQATKFIIYGGKNDNRVFACRGNTRYHSGLNDPTYWPESNYAAITSDAEKLVGFGKMYDYLINLKENSLTFTTIDSEPQGDIIFPVYPLNDEYGCLAPDSIQPVANGLIFFAQTATGAPAGVVYLSPTTVRNQLNAKVISEDINTSVHAGITGLTEYSRAEQAAAKSYIHDKKYWLRVGNMVWILDLRESDFNMGKYCWYPYDGPAAKANCFLEHGYNFYVGDDTNGAIYCENTGTNDGQEAINAYWTSPIICCGSRSWTKDFEELHIVFGPQVRANHTLSFITDDGQEDVPLEIDSARIFSYADINYGSFHYGSNPYPSKQTELVGYSAEYLQWIIGNKELNQGLTILAQELDYLWGERS